MNYVVKLFLAAAFALTFVPHSLANEWLPPDIIETIETGAFLEAAGFPPDSSGPTNIYKNRRADNPTTMTNGKQGAIPSAQHQSLNELLAYLQYNEFVSPTRTNAAQKNG